MPKLVPVDYDPFARGDTASPALNSVASKGRYGDTLLAHLTPGDIVIPKGAMTQAFETTLRNVLGEDFTRYQAGTSSNSRNPATGLPEFFTEASMESDGEAFSGEAGVVNTGPVDSDKEASYADAVNIDPWGEANNPTLSTPNLAGEDYTEKEPPADPAPSSYTGVGFIDRKIDKVLSDPMAAVINGVVGFTPVVGPAFSVYNAASNLTGAFPSIGERITDLVRSDSNFANPTIGKGLAEGSPYLDTVQQARSNAVEEATQKSFVAARANPLASTAAKITADSFIAAPGAQPSFVSGLDLKSLDLGGSLKKRAAPRSKWF